MLLLAFAPFLISAESWRAGKYHPVIFSKALGVVWAFIGIFRASIIKEHMVIFR